MAEELLGVRSVLWILEGGSSADGDSEIRLGEAEDCFAAGAERENGRDDEAEGDASGEDCWCGMRRRLRLSRNAKERRIRL